MVNVTKLQFICHLILLAVLLSVSYGAGKYTKFSSLLAPLSLYSQPSGIMNIIKILMIFIVADMK